MEFRAITAERLDDLAELFGTTAVTRRCPCTWFLLRDPERTEVWSASSMANEGGQLAAYGEARENGVRASSNADSGNRGPSV